MRDQSSPTEATLTWWQDKDQFNSASHDVVKPQLLASNQVAQDHSGGRSILVQIWASFKVQGWADFGLAIEVPSDHQCMTSLVDVHWSLTRLLFWMTLPSICLRVEYKEIPTIGARWRQSPSVKTVSASNIGISLPFLESFLEELCLFSIQTPQEYSFEFVSTLVISGFPCPRKSLALSIEERQSEIDSLASEYFLRCKDRNWKEKNEFLIFLSNKLLSWDERFPTV